MNEFIEKLSEIKIPITITQIEMNKDTSDKLLSSVPEIKRSESIGYLHSFTGIPIVNNDDLKDGEVKILYSDGKYKTISTIDSRPQKYSFKMEYECKWFND